MALFCLSHNPMPSVSPMAAGELCSVGSLSRSLHPNRNVSLKPDSSPGFILFNRLAILRDGMFLFLSEACHLNLSLSTDSVISSLCLFNGE
ncbi:hypothetical protein AYI70_g8786 [Smittium culicis]|uniref:Uncharacterized protein n=1 Tax=Smittium culicis TaxID=133412 RepID=A0A1R1XEC0_9FUNG|nr:hypothetical protein AYI70_g8786 [Smittium culicis]